MKVLLDVGVSPRLRQALQQQLGGVVVESADFHNWRSLRDDELLDAAERNGFTTLITTDKRMAAEQPHAQIAVIVVDNNSLAGLAGRHLQHSRRRSVDSSRRGLRRPGCTGASITRDPSVVTNWSDCEAQVAPQIVRIQTDDRSGTGFIFYGIDGGNRSIAIARHLAG